MNSESLKNKQLFKHANAAWKSRSYGEAIDLFQQYVDADPDNPLAYVNLARAYGLNFEYAKSRATTQSIAKKFGELPHILYALGESDLKYGYPDSAEQHFLSAIKLGLDSKHEVRAYVFLAKVRERLHRLDDALDAVGEALSKSPGHPRAMLTQAKIQMRLGHKEESIETLRALTKRSDISPDVQASAWYAIASHLEKHCRDFDQAFGAIENAKNAFSKIAGRHLEKAQQQRQNCSRMLAAITPEIIRSWEVPEGYGSGRLGWLLGHPRSGTTLLGQVLNAHSGVVTADEVQVFGSSIFNDVVSASSGAEPNLVRLLNNAKEQTLVDAHRKFYRQLQGALKEDVGSRFLLNKNPDLTFLLPALLRVFPQSQILFAIRDPRDVIISCFAKDLPLNPVSVEFFSLKTAAHKYSLAMDVWLKFRDNLAPENWMESRYEDLVTDFETQAKSLVSFLGLPWERNVNEFQSLSEPKKVKSPTYEAVTKPIYCSSIGRWRNYEKQLSPALEKLNPYIEKFGYEI